MRLSEATGIFLKGVGMGTANVIPGVSGGTIALVTGIYPRLIAALKAGASTETLRLAFGRRWAEAWQAIDGWFLTALAAGVVGSILTLARLFDFLLRAHEAATMAFFFGLVLVSIYHVGRTVGRWDGTEIAALVLGTAVAVGLAFVSPAEPNAGFGYLVLCGVVAICSMILPGLSGSFVLMLMGNYILVIRAIKEFDFGIIAPMGVGCAVGLLGFVQLLGWALRKAPSVVIALMTGFVLGSLLTIWPWKETVTESIAVADTLKEVVVGYRWLLPDFAAGPTWVAIALMVLGGVVLHVLQAKAIHLEKGAVAESAGR